MAKAGAIENQKADYIFVHFLPIKDTWVWQIPISDTVASIGVVTQKQRFIEANTDREKFFWDFVESRPELAAAHQAGDFKAERFAAFERKIRRAVKHWYEFISVYYRLNILFTAFVQDPRYRVGVLKLLQGDVYDDAPPTALYAMREVLTAVENDPTHLWHPYLGTLRAPLEAPTG